MSRAGASYRGGFQFGSLPILLVRALDIPAVNNPSVKVSLYLTGNQSDVTFFNEEGRASYTACALSYDQVAGLDGQRDRHGQVRLDNVAGRFTSLAKDYVSARGARVHLLETFADTLGSPDGARWIFQGHIERATISISAVEVMVKGGLLFQRGFLAGSTG